MNQIISSSENNSSNNQFFDSSRDNKTNIKKFILNSSRLVFNWIIIPVIVVIILHNFIFQAFHVVGSSMSPTLADSDYLIISKVNISFSHIAKLFNNKDYLPKRGSIIVFHYPDDPSLVFIKRVIALPGDRIMVKNGNITIYNQTYPDGFNPDEKLNLNINIPTLGEINETIPNEKIFVIGDNRLPGGSFDSRDWGLLPVGNIVGTAVLRLLPIDSIKIITTTK